MDGQSLACCEVSQLRQAQEEQLDEQQDTRQALK